ncbi:MAG: hypothetical protein OIF40_05425 [Mangrovicoccus sp.]|nr:hypothetical protein [Mangrovicoccus sp.]
MKLLAASFVLACLAMTAGSICSAQNFLVADLDGDGAMDQAVLAMSADAPNADLIIKAGGKLYFYPDLVFSSVMAGQEARLQISADGALEVLSGNHAVGRTRWDQGLTIAWFDNAFRLAKITRSWWDSMASGDDGHCEVDLRSGWGITNGPNGAREMRIDLGAPRLEEWNRVLPEGCRSS